MTFFCCQFLFIQIAKIQALKKTATKGDKKKKKDVAEEIAKLESEIEAKHAAELKKIQVVTLLLNLIFLVHHFL